MPGLKTSGLKKEFEKQLRVWNLMKVQEELLKTPAWSSNSLAASRHAYTIRQVLDLIAPNWRTAKSDLELEVEF